MQDITAGEIVARGNFRRARGFLMPLFAHYLITFQAELTVNGEKKSLTIYVGTYANPDQTYRYVQLDGSNMIMVVDNNIVLNLLNGLTPDEE